MTPSVRQLEIFLRVVECGNIGCAAEELRIAQLVASRALKALERGLGPSLLAQTARGARPIKARRALLARGTDLLRGFGELAAEVQRCASKPSGCLSVGVPPSLAGLPAERVLPGFARAVPRVTLCAHEAPTARSSATACGKAGSTSRSSRRGSPRGSST